MRVEPLTTEEQQLFLKYRKLVNYIAFIFQKKYPESWINGSDYIEEAYVALIVAVKNHDRIRTKKFSNFIWRVVLNYLRSKHKRNCRYQRLVEIKPLEELVYFPDKEIDFYENEEVMEFLARLTESDLRLLQLRFGIGCEEHTFRELEKTDGISFRKAKKALTNILERKVKIL